MSTPESLAAAFARGMMEAMLAPKAEKREKPAVVPVETVRAAVAQEVQRIIAEADAQQTPPAQQLDLYTHGIEDESGTEIENMMLRRIEEARIRKAASEHGDPPPGTYDPNLPHGSPWVSPERTG